VGRDPARAQRDLGRHRCARSGGELVQRFVEPSSRFVLALYELAKRLGRLLARGDLLRVLRLPLWETRIFLPIVDEERHALRERLSQIRFEVGVQETKLRGGDRGRKHVVACARPCSTLQCILERGSSLLGLLPVAPVNDDLTEGRRETLACIDLRTTKLDAQTMGVGSGTGLRPRSLTTRDQVDDVVGLVARLGNLCGARRARWSGATGKTSGGSKQHDLFGHDLELPSARAGRWVPLLRLGDPHSPNRAPTPDYCEDSFAAGSSFVSRSAHACAVPPSSPAALACSWQ